MGKIFLRRHKIILMLLTGFILLMSGVYYKYWQHAQDPLDPDEPILLTLWHYRIGSAKLAFDQTIAKFNQTEGANRGIVIEAYSIGNIQSLLSVVQASAEQRLGTPPMPDLFTAYNDHAYHIDKIYGLVNLADYFTQTELAQYNAMFLAGGQVGQAAQLKNLPTAKSTECIYLNKTDWDKFAEKTGAKLEELKTWDGIEAVAERYYNWSGGKAFWGMQTSINFIRLTAAADRQYNGIADREQTPELYYSKAAARKIWELYYKGSMQGYYSSTVEENQSMSPLKRGELLMTVASTAGAVYCPSEVLANANTAYPIQVSVLAYPYYEEQAKYTIIRGNSFCIVKSDYQHEYAAAVFLKWLTDRQQNIEYAVLTGYLPVETAALADEQALLAYSEAKQDNPTVRQAQQISLAMLKDYHWYESLVTEQSYRYDQLFERRLREQLTKDKLALAQQLQTGSTREQALGAYLTEEHFDQWYEKFIKAAKYAIN